MSELEFAEKVITDLEKDNKPETFTVLVGCWELIESF